VSQLPLRVLSISEIENNKQRGEEAFQNCLVCLSEYEKGDEVRTMPCLHYFHKDCIDKWLGKSNNCPICKFDIKKNYNAISIGQK
jgi:E3 ubiquitin-protein ligase DOA10